MNLKYEISKPKFELGEKVVIQYPRFAAGVIKNREIDLRYNPDVDESPREAGWMYLVMITSRDGHTVPENLISHLQDIQQVIDKELS